MTDELTPAEKRKQTMAARYGDDWRKTIGQLAKEGGISKRGEAGYKAQRRQAGQKGGGKNRPNSRPFKRKQDLAKAAGKKGSDRRWGKND